MRSSFIAAAALATGFVSVLIYNVGVSHASDIRQEAPSFAATTPTGVQFIVTEQQAAELPPLTIEPEEAVERAPMPRPRPSFEKPAISTPSITYLD